VAAAPEGRCRAAASRLPSFRLRRRVWLIGPLALYALLRIPSFLEPHWYTDEAGYVTTARALLQGKVLYSQIWTNKPPLQIWTVAAVIQLPRHQRGGPPRPHLPDRVAHPARHRLRRGPPPRPPAHRGRPGPGRGHAGHPPPRRRADPPREPPHRPHGMGGGAPAHPGRRPGHPPLAALAGGGRRAGGGGDRLPADGTGRHLCLRPDPGNCGPGQLAPGRHLRRHRRRPHRGVADPRAS
jgi:hypothetical protein